MKKGKLNKNVEPQAWGRIHGMDYCINYSQHFSGAFELSEEEKRILDVGQENIELKRELERYKYLEKKNINNNFFNS